MKSAALQPLRSTNVPRSRRSCASASVSSSSAKTVQATNRVMTTTKKMSDRNQSNLTERQWAIFCALLETLNARQMTTLFRSLQFLEVLAGKEGTEVARTYQLKSLESALRVNEALTDPFSWNITQFMEMLDDLSLNAIPEMVQEMNRPQDVLVLQNIAQDGRASHSNTSSVTLSTAFAAAQTATSGAMPIDLDGTYDTAVVCNRLETASIGTGFMSEGSTPATASVVKQETSPSSAEPWKTDE